MINCSSIPFLSFECMCAIAISPVLYNGLIAVTKYFVQSSATASPHPPPTSSSPSNYIKNITMVHNYVMTCQSVGLFALILSEYLQISTKHQIPWYHFMRISNKGAEMHRNGENAYILILVLGSKLWEWIDTLMLIANGKKIGLLHWWHHSTITVAFYTGFYTSVNYSVGLLNSFIHVIMYLYYAEISWIRPFAKYLTTLQILQLFSGFGINVYSYLHTKGIGGGAKFKTFSIINAFLCLSYGLLFVQFYFEKYCETIDKKKSPPMVASKKDPNSSCDPIFISIGDFRYDITHFKHPGGNVIHYYTSKDHNQDATAAFTEFHYRSKKAQLVLQSLPKSPMEKKQHEHEAHTKIEQDRRIMESFGHLRHDLEIRGFFKPSVVHVLYRVMELIGMFTLAIYTIHVNRLLSVLIFGLFGARCGWIQHEGGHNSLTGNIGIDKRIQNVFCALGIPTDGSMWNSMHNKHHATPQKIGHDIDLDTAPFVAFYDRIGGNHNLGKVWFKYQMYTFLPITSGIFVNMFWMFYLHPRKMLRDKNVTQLCLVAFSHMLRISLFHELASSHISWKWAICHHFASLWVSSVYLFGHFSLSHTFTPVIENTENPNWVRYAIEHTVDICPDNWIVSWIMGYLNCQVIHHLFPSMPQFYGPRVSEELKRFCVQWNLKYRVIGYFEAWRLMFANLHRVGETLSNRRRVLE